MVPSMPAPCPGFPLRSPPAPWGHLCCPGRGRGPETRGRRVDACWALGGRLPQGDTASGPRRATGPALGGAVAGGFEGGVSLASSWATQCQQLTTLHLFRPGGGLVRLRLGEGLGEDLPSLPARPPPDSEMHTPEGTALRTGLSVELQSDGRLRAVAATPPAHSSSGEATGRTGRGAAHPRPRYVPRGEQHPWRGGGSSVLHGAGHALNQKTFHGVAYPRA